MSLSTGTRLGPYEILTPLGAGGMGEVYKARDTRLDRTVAVKVLPEHLSQKPQLRERFEREARAVSSLNHSNICTLHDVGQQDDVDYLVMEYLEGDTLAQRLKKGALPLDQALRYAIEIAGALDHAHRHGVVHRDLKPGNIMLTKAGAKVLDFGLAKVHASAGTPDVTQPTNTMTEEGVILGTLQYMAPEQLEGKEADARSDIFAFGAVVYEMATGKKAFEGKSRASVIAAILEREPPPLSTLDPMTPAALDRVVKKCLAKDPDRRWQSAQDLKDELQWIGDTGSQAAAAAPTLAGFSHGMWAWVAAAAVASLIAGAFAFAYFVKKSPTSRVTRFSFSPPFKTDFMRLAVSPDGRRVAFTGATPIGGRALWLRAFDSLIAEQLPGTEDGDTPFWSPDGHSIGFTSEGKLKKISVGGGQSSVHTISSFGAFGTWGANDVIVFTANLPGGSGLYRVAASGGTPTAATRLNSTRQEIDHRFPQFLPDGRHFLYWVLSGSDENTGIYLGSLDPNDRLNDHGLLLRTWRAGVYTAGFLLFLEGSTLVAQQFDTEKLRLVGEPKGLPDHVSTLMGLAGDTSLASSGGILGYQEALTRPASRLVWLDRAGKQLRSVELPPGASSLALAPDEVRLAFCDNNDRDLEDIWVMDLERGASTRLTTGASNLDPRWSPDGRRIVFRSNRAGVYDLYAKDAGGVGSDELLAKSANWKHPLDWSRDGRWLLYAENDPATKFDLWILPLDGNRQPVSFLKTAFNEPEAKFSPVPDSQGRHWVAYGSDETGGLEIYLRPFTPGGAAGTRLRVSTGGGSQPRWRNDGRELFYLANRKVMAVDVELGEIAKVGSERTLFDLPPFVAPRGNEFAAFGDGRRFLFAALATESPAAKINVVLNWQAELKR